jgi:phytol kinase
MILQDFLSIILNDFVVLAIAYAYVLFMILLPVTLKKRDKISKFTARKMVHLFAGLVIYVVPFFIIKWWAVVIAGSITLTVLFSEKGSKVKLLDDLYEAISEEQEEKLKRQFLQGPFNYALAITILMTIFVIIAPNQMYLPIAGLTIMIIADTLASILGKKYGKHEINLSWTGTKRTVEGSLVFFICSLVVCLITFFLFGMLIQLPGQTALSLPQVIIYSLITSVIGMIIELLSPSTWDDLTIPIGTTLLIWLLTFVIVI